MTLFQVATFVTVEAEDPKQAALKAYALHHEMTPEEYVVGLTDNEVVEITLEQDERIEVLRLHREGKLFNEVKS